MKGIVDKGKDGYITVMFTLVFVTMVSLSLAAVESVRISAVRSRIEMACALALDSFLSQYQPQVQSRYGLYLVERDGYDSHFLQSFIQKNIQSGEAAASWTGADLLSAAINGETHVDADNYKYLIAQISDLMKTRGLRDAADTLLDAVSDINSYAPEKQKEQLENRLESQGELAEVKKQQYEVEKAEAQDTSETTGAKPDKEVRDPRKNIGQMLKNPVLSLVLPQGISGQSVDLSTLSYSTPAEKTAGNIKSFMDYHSVSDSLKKSEIGLTGVIADKADELLLDAYILEYLKNASAPDEIQEHSVLNYEAEYILGGKASDEKNIEYVVNRLLLIRMLLNLTYLYGSTEKKAAVQAVSVSLAAAVLMPFLEPVFTLLILAAWAYGEAIVDCRSLLSGKKVPLMKDAGSWTLSLGQLTSITAGQLDGFSRENDSQDGLSYEDYIRLLLLSLSKEKKCMRLLNLIEANTRLNDNCAKFMMAQCVFGISICADFEFGALFIDTPWYGKKYEHHVIKSCNY